MSHQALYRKYRPQTFAEVVGQGHVTETLASEVVAGTIAHAYLFAGPRGTGKTTTARILAKAINCADLQAGGEPCNICDSCVAITSGNSMDVVELDAASHNKVEDVREIRVNVGTVASVGGAHRVYILDEAHMLSRAASNALLKTLEEPPEHVHFVLATTEPYKLSDTIRSRAQRFDFHAIGSEALIDHLVAVAAAERLQVSNDALALIVRHATGSARDALGLLEQVAALGGGAVDQKGVARALGLADSEVLERLVGAVADQDAAAALTLVSGIAAAGADLRRLVADAVELFRGLFLAQYAPNLEEVVDEPAEVIAQWRLLAKRLSAADVLRCIDLLGAALTDLREGREERLVVELALLKMTRPDTAPDVAALTARLDRVEERIRRLGSGEAPQPAPAAAPPEREREESVLPPGDEAPAAPAASEPSQDEAATDPVDEVAEAEPEAEPPVGAPSVPAASAGAVTVDVEELIEKWPVVVARVREEAGPRRFALFREAMPDRAEGAVLTLTVPGPFHRDQLTEDDVLRGVVTAVLSDVAGVAVTVRYEAGDGTPSPERVETEESAPDKDDLIESSAGAIDPTALVVDLLDGEIVSD